MDVLGFPLLWRDSLTKATLIKENVIGTGLELQKLSIIIMAGSMAAGRQAWHWSSSWELTSLSTRRRQRGLRQGKESGLWVWDQEGLLGRNPSWQPDRWSMDSCWLPLQWVHICMWWSQSRWCCFGKIWRPKITAIQTYRQKYLSPGCNCTINSSGFSLE